MKKRVYETIMIIIGNLILAFGLCAFVTPVGLISGGAVYFKNLYLHGFVLL